MTLPEQVQFPSFIEEVIAKGAGLHPHKTALVHGDRKLTYCDLQERTTALAQRLRELRLEKTRGGILIENSPEYIITYFAIATTQSVIVPFKSHLPLDRLISEIEYCDIDYIVTTAKHADRLKARIGMLRRIRWLIVLEADNKVRATPINATLTSETLPDRKSSSVALMLSTSGTLSKPKWVMLSHENVLGNMASFLDVAKLQNADVSLIALPLTSSGTNTTEMLAYLYCGMSVVLYHHSTFLLNEYCRLIENTGATVVNVTPFVLELMLRNSKKVAARLTSLKKVFFASAPCARRSLLKLQQEFPRFGFHYGYGLTEAGPRCTTLRPSLLSEKLGSAGTPLKGVEIRIVALDGSTLPVEQTGEITVRSSHVMVGYYKQPVETTTTLRNGWLHTGDAGYLDADGFLYVKGRLKNVIVSRGFKICPEEVEEVLLTHPEVEDACVKGHPDAAMWEKVIAYVVPRVGSRPSEGELKSFLSLYLEKVKVPHSIVFANQLQRNDQHKLLRGADPRTVSLV